MSSHAAFQYTRSGRLSGTLEKATRPTPTPNDKEMLVRVKAAALNPVDQQLAQSGATLLKFMGAAIAAPSAESPWIPCNDFSGEVEVAGKDSGWKVGDKVFGMKPFGPVDGNGTMQEYLLVNDKWPIARVPPNLTMAEAAALPLVYMTVYDALVNYGRLDFDGKDGQDGEGGGGRSLLVLGGSSGTGSVAVQMGKKMGLKVVATCSGKNVDFVKSLGADEVIDYTKEDVSQAALMSRHAPYAVVLDCVGGKDVVQHMDNLVLHDLKAPRLGIYVTIVGDKTGRDAMGGALTNYYYPSQAIRTFRGGLRDSLPDWLPLKSSIAGTRYACIMLTPSKEMMESIPAFLEHAKRVLIDSTWKFEDVRQAYEKLETSRAVGKIVVEME